MKNYIPVNTPIFTGNEKKYLLECIESSWISSEGPFVKKFEKEFASYIGTNFGVACSNGSAALDIAIAALQLKFGDEVILPTFSIISPALSIIKSGATPVLVDSNIDTWNMNVEEIENKITSSTKAILVVHIYGLPVDMDPILALCQKYNLFLIEDAAEAHGQTYKGKKCGSYGDISTFSFYPNKNITSGEGGMCLTNNEDLAIRCQKLRNLSFEPNKRRFVHYEIGWNYRMTNLQAAIGLAQLEKIDLHLAIKKNIGHEYQRKLNAISSLQLPLEKTAYAKNLYWVFGIVVENEKLLESLLHYLNKNKIGTRPFFWCIHEQPVFKKMGLFKNSSFPNSEKLARCGFYLPSGLGLQKEEINFICEKINSADFLWKS